MTGLSASAPTARRRDINIKLICFILFIIDVGEYGQSQSKI